MLDDRGIGVLFPARKRDFYSLISVQTGAGTRLAFSPMDADADSVRVKPQDVKLTIYLLLLPRLSTVDLYLLSCLRLCGRVLN
jgi:hypothetical protein